MKWTLSFENNMHCARRGNVTLRATEYHTLRAMMEAQR